MAASPVVLVTGASRGLGLGIVNALVTKYSARVVVLSRNTSSDLAALPSSSLHFIQCDITQDATAKSAISQTLNKFGRLDSIVLNAGTLDPVVKIKDSTPTGWKECFNVNVFCNIPLITEALPHLRSSHGSIIFISSGAATNAYSGWSAYSASKAAINSLTQSLALEEPSITSLAIRPGVVDTEMQNDIRTKRAPPPISQTPFVCLWWVLTVDGEAMGENHDKFMQLKKDDKLLSPKVVGDAIARMAVCGQKEKLHEYSGKFVNWDDDGITSIL